MRFSVHADHAVILLTANIKIALLLQQDTRLIKLQIAASHLLAAKWRQPLLRSACQIGLNK